MALIQSDTVTTVIVLKNATKKFSLGKCLAFNITDKVKSFIKVLFKASAKMYTFWRRSFLLCGCRLIPVRTNIYYSHGLKKAF